MHIQGSITTIGGYNLRTHVLEPNSKEEHRYVIEATAEEHPRVGQYLPIHALRNISPADIPNDFYLCIEDLDARRTKFRNLRFLTLTKKQDVTKICVIITLDNWDWHIPESLHGFVDRYVNILNSSESQNINATSEPDDTGFSVYARSIVSPDQDIYEAFLQLSGLSLKAYREAVSIGYSTPSKSITTQAPKHYPIQPATDAHGLRWWVRYVVVPIVGS